MTRLLFYTIGYPGAGKTTLAANLASWFGGHHLRADKIGMSLFVVPTFSEAERVAVYQHMDYQAMQVLNKGRVVAYDGALNSAAQRKHLHQLAEQHGSRAVGLWLSVPEELAKTRAGRLRDVGVGGGGGRIVPPEIFEKYKAAFERPTSDEFFVRIDGQLPFGYQYRAIWQGLRKRGISLPRFIEL